MKNQGLIGIFSRSPVAANLLMMIMFLVGGWALTHLNVQFLPDYEPKNISVSVIWPGAGAQDVEQSMTIPLELELRNIDNLKEMTSTSRLGSNTINLEFFQNANMMDALEQVKERVAQVRNLPPDSETPVVVKITPYEPISKLLISGPDDLGELRQFSHKAERELLERGIAKIDVIGLPEEEIAIQIPSYRISELRLSLPTIADIIAARSKDLPAGIIAKQEQGILLRSLEQRRDPFGFENIPIVSQSQGRLLTLGDIATIRQRAKEGETKVSYNGKPAIQFNLQRSLSASTLTGAETAETWLKKTREDVGNSLNLKLFEERWQYIGERIQLLLKNGTQGLILIILVLLLFLNGRVAFWVTLGIPTSFLAALGVLALMGGSINMISLFAFIMSIGIIVDDTIVVGEETLTQYNNGHSILNSLDFAIKKMLKPIVASSLTTVCAFIPIMMVGETMGDIIFDIPIVVICVILASLLECFFVLPGHLHHSLKKHELKNEPKWRQSLKQGLTDWRENQFRHFITRVIERRWLTVLAAFSLFAFSISLITTGVLNFTFFPSPVRPTIAIDIQFSAGTPSRKITTFLNQLDKTVKETNNDFKKSNGENILKTVVLYQNRSYSGADKGEQYASIVVEFISANERDIDNATFINAWRKKIVFPPNIENFSILEPRAGPPGSDIDIQFSDSNVENLKKVALLLQNKIKTYPGVNNVTDDLPLGQPQLIFTLTPTGRSLGLTIEQIAEQLYAAFNGRIVQIFHHRGDEIEVRIMLADNERERLATLERLPIITPEGQAIPMSTVATLQAERKPNILRHTDGLLTVHVTADVNKEENNANKILRDLKANYLPQLEKDYHLKTAFAGQAERQQETLSDMKRGLLLGILLIYIILAWVFSSYGWPLVIMITIPLGITGAILGHWFMGIDLTVISLFGFFGLAGIVINDSIILLNEYKHQKQENIPTHEAIVNAICLRLRAVVLTSITTIAGLLPLLFETSLQAQFLIPMAISISFGLAFATFLILLVIPALLSIYEDLFNHRASNISPTLD